MSIYGEKFKKAFDLCMELEGGSKYHEVKGDAGGATKYGVSLRFLKGEELDINGDGVVDKTDIKDLTKEQAQKIAYEHFYNEFYEELYLPLSVAVFCTGYNMGARMGVKLLQRACNSLGSNLSEDGIIGAKTVIESKKYVEDRLLIAYGSKMLDYYIDICLVRQQNMKFLKGWKNRTLKLLQK